MREFLEILEDRFNENIKRHPEISFEKVKCLLTKEKLKTLFEMENTGGEVDCTVYEGKIIYCDFSKESPKERRSLCYDRNSRINRKKNPPVSSCEEMANKMGAKLVDEKLYFFLQNISPLDIKTSSWLKTDEKLLELGGAIFGDRRYERVFIYHNGSDSYYSSRGFRCYIELE